MLSQVADAFLRGVLLGDVPKHHDAPEQAAVVVQDSRRLVADGYGISRPAQQDGAVPERLRLAVLERAPDRIVDGQPVFHASQGSTSSIGLPTASASFQPVSASATGSRNLMFPAASVTATPSPSARSVVENNGPVRGA